MSLTEERLSAIEDAIMPRRDGGKVSNPSLNWRDAKDLTAEIRFWRRVHERMTTEEPLPGLALPSLFTIHSYRLIYEEEMQRDG